MDVSFLVTGRRVLCVLIGGSLFCLKGNAVYNWPLSEWITFNLVSFVVIGFFCLYALFFFEFLGRNFHNLVDGVADVVPRVGESYALFAGPLLALSLVMLFVAPPVSDDEMQAVRKALYKENLTLCKLAISLTVVGFVAVLGTAVIRSEKK